ncbi:MAG: hypothetical protein ABW007_19535 [Chitinophagaceae bacterium]
MPDFSQLLQTQPLKPMSEKAFLAVLETLDSEIADPSFADTSKETLMAAFSLASRIQMAIMEAAREKNSPLDFIRGGHYGQAALLLFQKRPIGSDLSLMDCRDFCRMIEEKINLGINIDETIFEVKWSYVTEGLHGLLKV